MTTAMDIELPVLSLQEVFNKAYAHALTMTEKCSTTTGSGDDICCYYKEENGKINMCLIGAVLGPEIAKEVASDNVHFGNSACGLNNSKYRFCHDTYEALDELQVCHDLIGNKELNFNEILIRNLNNYAKTYKLSIPDVQAS